MKPQWNKNTRGSHQTTRSRGNIFSGTPSQHSSDSKMMQCENVRWLRIFKQGKSEGRFVCPTLIFLWIYRLAMLCSPSKMVSYIIMKFEWPKRIKKRTSFITPWRSTRGLCIERWRCYLSEIDDSSVPWHDARSNGGLGHDCQIRHKIGSSEWFEKGIRMVEKVWPQTQSSKMCVCYDF